MKAIKLAAVLVTLLAMPAGAETNGTLRIGVLNDMSSVYADFQGPGSVVAAQMAVEDFAKQSKRKVEVTSGDHQNKPDIGAGIARRWLDVEGVDMIIDMPNSAVALGSIEGFLIPGRSLHVVVEGFLNAVHVSEETVVVQQ